jgi:hypothetical protein
MNKTIIPDMIASDDVKRVTILVPKHVSQEAIDAFKKDYPAYIESRKSRCNKCGKEFEKSMKAVIEKLAKIPFDPPVMYFKYPERSDFNINHFIHWFDCLESYFSVAKYYEEQERGSACHVDRAWQNYATPELKKMLNYLLTEQKQVKD